MAKELLSLDYILACHIILGSLCCSEVVACDLYPILHVEFSQHLIPLVSWILPISRIKHDVRRAHDSFVCFDSVDCLLVNHDDASGRLLGRKVQRNKAIFVSFLLCNGGKGQANNILDSRCHIVKQMDERVHFW